MEEAVQYITQRKMVQSWSQAVSPTILLSTTSPSRFGCFDLGLDFGCIARLTFGAGGLAEGVIIVCVDVSVTVVVEVKEAAAVIEDTLGAKRVLRGFLEGDGGSEDKCMDERGLVVALIAGFIRVEAVETTDLATDLARGLRLDLGLACDEDGLASSISTSVSDEGFGAVLALLDVLDRVRTLLWLAPESESESSESASTALRERLREADGGS